MKKPKRRPEDLYQHVLRMRRVILTAIGSDDVLSARLVLKGGNALEIAHALGSRASLDMDFSIDGDFMGVDELRVRLFHALRERLDATGFHIFDESLEPRPHEEPGKPKRWGGYRVEFKVIPREKFILLGGDVEAMRRDSEFSGLQNNRRFTLEISRDEYCEGKILFEIDGFSVYSYSVEMIVAEKIRAICQQMPGYPARKNPAPRPRDFFDIYELIAKRAVELLDPDTRELVQKVFDTKEVPVSLIGEIPNHRDFHEIGWPAVKDSIFGIALEFDFYFEFVVGETRKLESLWNP